ncbi:hypothetical protein EVJ20_13310 [Exiguobacterium sp. SH0S1]|uniref:hypothetical protein n=1 Tax=Exiguobacterium sp. SH0S1 TaxID=2510949 RepID=UPI00103A3EC8|nr:hypothetical protein [Exiguobacterium sp. SH0S1]TCI75663.1 hypothetical protein EVJ20_13310 [Exiguobacterium sp. SH0S1]
MMNIDEMRQRRLTIMQSAEKNLQEMASTRQETERVADIAANPQQVFDDLEVAFEKQTGLDKVDMTFLFFATALQCVRQYWLSNEKLRFKNDQAASKTMKRFTPISLAGPVSYDAFKKDMFFDNTGISGANHRYTTLGHDPLLGWIFGTANILSDTITKNNIMLESYNTNLIGNEYKISSLTHIGSVFQRSFMRVQADVMNLVTAVLKHALHLGSDAFTKMGLPIPILNSINPNISATLLKNSIDSYSVGRSMAVSSFINALIAVIHSLFYDEVKHQDLKLYEVKTRKILMYSNVIATSSNLIYVGLQTYLGDKTSLKKLDVGGLIVTIHRIISDETFIRQIKEEFVLNGFKHKVLGEQNR